MNMLDKIPTKYITQIFQTGSSIICNPPILNTDIDYCILTPNLDIFDDIITKIGFITLDNEDYLEVGKFVSYRYGKYNLIVTDNREFFFKFKNATDIAKALNLLKKEDRVILFQYILYDKLPL